MSNEMPTVSVTVKEVSVEELRRCIEIFEATVHEPIIINKLSTEERNRLFIAIGRTIRPDQIEIRRKIRAIRSARNEAKRNADRHARSKTTIRIARTQSVFVPPQRKLIDQNSSAAFDSSGPENNLRTPDHCYICKQEFSSVHHFYDSLCASCASLNYEKRFQTASLVGRVAVITGARLKIGYQAALMMLRAGASVIVTTRFPVDAASRYSKEDDFENWSERLQIYGLDLRHSPSVEAFTSHLNSTLIRLDVLINNAAQTVRRPPGFFAHLLEVEEQPVASLKPQISALLRNYLIYRHELEQGQLERNQDRNQLSNNSGHPIAPAARWIPNWKSSDSSSILGLIAPAQLSQITHRCDELQAENSGLGDSRLFPAGKLDADLQQIDLRSMNSWRMKLADVPTEELLEVQLINAIAPFILCSKLKPLMMRDRTDEKHIINVSAMEGKFNRGTKTDKHPHTNMAKAALNMMTLTAARDYANVGIFMNAVDTGWVTDEDPAELAARKTIEHDFQPPLDIVDGAARVLDPLFAGLKARKHMWGNFLKDYAATSW